MARSHANQDWTLDQLRESVLTEIKVLESGTPLDMATEPTNRDLPSTMTASFYAGAHNHTSKHRVQSKPMSCIYCPSTTHSPSACNTVSGLT